MHRSGSIVCHYDATIDRVIANDITLTTTNTLKLNDESILEIPISITIYAGDFIGQYTQTLPENFGDLNKTFFEYTPLVINTDSTEQFNDNVSLALIFSEITPTPTPTPTVTPYIPENDFIYNIIPNGDFIYSLIPNSDLTYTLIPSGDFSSTFIPNNDVTYVTLPDNDTLYSIIPNNDSTYTLIPNNDIEYNVLKPGNSFYGEIKLGESDIEGTCNCPEWECPRFYVTGDGPTFCDSNIFVTNGDGFNLNGWGTIVHNGFYKTVNMDGSNIATYRTDCGVCPITPTPTPTVTPTPTETPTLTPTETPTPTPTETIVPYNKIVDLNINSLSSYSGSGTTVTDILGNTTASIFGSPSYQNDGCTSSIVLNGTDQYVITDTSIESFYNSTDTSLFLWVYLTDNGVILSEQGGGGLNFGCL